MVKFFYIVTMCYKAYNYPKLQNHVQHKLKQQADKQSK